MLALRNSILGSSSSRRLPCLRRARPSARSRHSAKPPNDVEVIAPALQTSHSRHRRTRAIPALSRLDTSRSLRRRRPAGAGQRRLSRARQTYRSRRAPAPSCLAVAVHLREYGARVTTVAEQAPCRSSPLCASLWSQPARSLQGIATAPLFANTPYRTGCWPVFRSGRRSHRPAKKCPLHRWRKNMGRAMRSARLRISSRAQHRGRIAARLQTPRATTS